MRTIIAGSRECTDMMYLLNAIARCGWDVTHVVCGGARGADTLGETWALEHNIPITYHIPDWKRFGIRAGHIRNAHMADDADALIALWNGYSKGTGNMIDLARAKRLKTYVELI